MSIVKRLVMVVGVLLSVMWLTGCIGLPVWLYPKEDEIALNTARGNFDAGLDYASVWCYTPSGSFDDQGNEYPIVTSVNSLDMLYYGGCEGILKNGKGATQCSEVGGGWFCVIADDPTIGRGQFPVLQ